MKEYYKNKGYLVTNNDLFKSLAHTFHILAETEENNISKKKKTDEKFEEDYRKKKREKKMKEKEGSLEKEKEPHADPALVSKSLNKGIKRRFLDFELSKRIITPLLLASEKVVEYWTPVKNIENKEEGGLEATKDNETDINDKMSKLTLEEIERKNRKRTIKSLRKSNKPINISKNLMNKASD